MVAKQLHELLGEDQEPFLLSSYVADRSFLISTEPPVKSQLRSSKQMPASLNSILSGNLRKGSCFFSFPDSPDPRRSPSPTYVKLRSTGNPSSVFLHVPAKTAALLLEAALRIQRNSPPSRPTKSSNGRPLFRQFGSLLKRLTHRNWTKKAKQRRASGGCACRGSDGESRCSSSGFEAGWSSDFEEDHENVGFESKVMDEEDYENRLANPSSGYRSPVISSPPASSPILHELKDKNGSDPESSKKLTVDDEEEEEGGKEQCSPVCVLDPLLEDDDREEEDGDAHEHGNGHNIDFDDESRFAIEQRTKQQLLCKLYRFEKLVELDPIELEISPLELDDEEDHGTDDEPEYTRFLIEEEKLLTGATKPTEELLAKEGRKTSFFEDRETMLRGVCKRLEMWKEADFDRIDMMAEQDMRSDLDGWIRRDREPLREAPAEIEVAIFGLMLEELVKELVYFP